MSSVAILTRVARTDSAFELREPFWVGKCLICNGPIAFDARNGEGATLEHIRAQPRRRRLDRESRQRPRPLQ